MTSSPLKHETGRDSGLATATTPSTSSTFDNQASPAGSTLATSMSSASSQQGEDMKVIYCRWQGCARTYDDPEDLYQHLCNDHVGRKSTNNLCLGCKWEGCDVTCAKRDHITSHLRVHTPLKPHACDACGKLFKRPQDLKKHERIHTEQHHQARQLKYQAGPTNLSAYNVQQGIARYGMEPGPAAAAAAAAAAWAGARSDVNHGGHSGVMSMYPTASQQAYQAGAGHSMYPSLPGAYRHISPSTGSAPFGGSAQIDSSSNTNSLSPLSSHLGTPGTGSSPAAHSQLAYQHHHVVGMERGYMSMQHDRPKPNDDPNSYAYLAQGSSLTGSKRSIDATANFFDDVRRKRLAPTYDPAMAARLESSFADGIDDATLQALLSSFQTDAVSQSGAHGNANDALQSNAAISMGANMGNAPQHSDHGNHSRLSLPEALKQTDLAELNAFLLQVGANAARPDHQDVRSASVGATQQPPGPGIHHQQTFDFQAALAASGLGGIAGFDESLLQVPSTSSDYASYPSVSSTSATGALTESTHPAWPHASFAHRPIAQLPHRATQMGHAYQTHSLVNAASQPSSMSFDSMRTSRGPAYVPQLGVKEMQAATYRHVEPLTRAAPDVERSVSAPSASYARKDATDINDETHVDEIMDEADQGRPVTPTSHSSSSPLPSVAKSPSFGLYPRMTIVDPTRRMPALPTSIERSSMEPPLTSFFAGQSSASSSSSSTSEALWRERHSRASFSSASPSPPPSSLREAAKSNAREERHSSSLYPRLSSTLKEEIGQQKGTMDGISRDVAALDVASPPSQTSADAQSEVPLGLRQHHARLIIDLLVALNRPRNRSGTPNKLPPLRNERRGKPSTSMGEADDDADMDRSPTPTLTGRMDRHNEEEMRSDDTEHASKITQTSPLPPSRTLPRIRDLLNDVNVPARSEVRGAGGRRIMDVDV